MSPDSQVGIGGEAFSHVNESRKACGLKKKKVILSSNCYNLSLQPCCCEAERSQDVLRAWKGLAQNHKQLPK